METLSVIIPAYNAQKYLPEAVLSVRSQAKARTEFIVIDDGSTDGTVQTAKDLGCTVLEKRHGGAAGARNMGIQKAKGDCLLLLDADDRLHEGALERMSAALEEDSQAMGVFCLCRDFISEDLTLEERKGLQVRPAPYGGILPGCSLLKKEVFGKVGLFREDLSSGETVDWMMRLRKSGLRTIELPIVSLERRIHLQNTSRVARSQEMRNYAEILLRRMKERKNA